MPKVYQRKARKTRFQYGRKVKANNKQGYTVNFYEPSLVGEDPVVCRAGETYYTWHPKGQPWQHSKERPVFEPRENEYQLKLEEFQQDIDSDLNEDDKTALQYAIEEYRDELQQRLDNMPEQLQESSILNERINELTELAESIEF